MPDPLTASAPGGAGPVLVIATGHALSLALVDGADVLGEHHEPLARGHAEALVPALQDLLAGERRPAEVRVETGPGSFTGLRVGIAAARALGLAWGVPVRGVSSSQLVAAEAEASGMTEPLLVVLAAPRGQIWLEPLRDFVPLAPAEALPAEAARARVVAWPHAMTGSGLEVLGVPALQREPRARFGGLVPEGRLGPPLPRYVRAHEAREAA